MFNAKFWTVIGRTAAVSATATFTALLTKRVTEAVGAGISTTAKKLFENNKNKEAIKEGKDKAVKTAVG